MWTTFRHVRRADADDTTISVAWVFKRLGFLAGLLGLTIGAVGPLIAPVFRRCGLVKERMIATKAVCQMMSHLLKVPIFIASGLVDYASLGKLILVMSLMVIPGTLIGKKVLERVDERTFVQLFKFTLLLAGIKVLCYDGIYGLWGP